MKKELIVVYSLEGKAKALAVSLALSREADLYEIKCVFEPKGFFKYVYFGYKAMFQKDVKLIPDTLDISAYTLCTMIGPIHGGSVGSPIVSFMKKHLKEYNTVNFILCHAAKDDDYLNSVHRLEDHLCLKFNQIESKSI